MAGELVTAVLLTSLRVTTSTPDALCPTPRATEEAIAARLGEVRQEGLVATYRVVQGAEVGDLLVLDLLDASGNLLLHRELPLDQLSCVDAATALALQLETYFSTLAATDQTAQPSSPAEAPPEAPGPPADPRAPEALQKPPEADESGQAVQNADPGEGRWGLSLSIGVSALESPLVGANIAFRPVPSVELGVFGDVALARTSFFESGPDGQESKGSTYAAWSGLSARYRLHGARWSLGAGPSAVVLLQTARLLGTSDVRTVWGLGGELLGRYQLTRGISLDTGFRAGPLLSDLTKTWSVIVSGAEREVLPLPDFFLGAWLGVSFWPK